MTHIYIYTLDLHRCHTASIADSSVVDKTGVEGSLQLRLSISIFFCFVIRGFSSLLEFSRVLQLRPRFLASSRALPGFAASTKVSRVFSSSPGFCSFDKGFSSLLEFSRFLQLRRRFLVSSRVLPVFTASTKVSRGFSSSPGFCSSDEGFSSCLEFYRVRSSVFSIFLADILQSSRDLT